MADIIQLLPDSVANQIAAGEVVQRPASVIKELMENSVDAGATEISVYIIDAGKTSIQVVDNGKGMSETDARMAFERHATSKIRNAADLFNLHTMGFRGEALASIAAVAQVELHTCQAQSDLGIFLAIEGARVMEQKPVVCPVGASFTINNLFFNVPARRRFLKSNQTETNNIMIEFERVALIHPEIGFAFFRDGEQTLNLRPSSFRKRIVSLFGSNMDKQLLPLAVETDLVKISGFVGTPQSARVKGAHQFFFVNGRYMRHPHFARAVQVAFERLVPQDRQVPFFLALEVDASRIDVNIHPTKTEIKFADEQAIWQILLAASREALGKFNAVPTIDFMPTGVPEMPVLNKAGHYAPPSEPYDRTYNPFRQDGAFRSGAASQHSWEELYASLRHDTSGVPASASERLDLPADALLPGVPAETPADPTLYAERAMDEQRMWNQEQMVFIQHAERYLVTSVKAGLMVIDQYRASLRINYDKYIQQLQQRDGVSQGLLFTESLQIPAAQIKAFSDYLADFRAVGFDITDEGHGTFSITGVPAGTESQQAVPMVLDIFEDLLARTGQPQDKVYHTIALSLAGKNVVRYGQGLSTAEVQSLINALFACQDPNYTPDGKNILSVLPSERIDALFR